MDERLKAMQGRWSDAAKVATGVTCLGEVREVPIGEFNRLSGVMQLIESRRRDAAMAKTSDLCLQSIELEYPPASSSFYCGVKWTGTDEV